jgi:hypothetical protein
MKTRGKGQEKIARTRVCYRYSNFGVASGTNIGTRVLHLGSVFRGGGHDFTHGSMVASNKNHEVGQKTGGWR